MTRSAEDKAQGRLLMEAAEREHLETIKALKETLLGDLALGHLESTLRLPVLTWLDIIDEIEDRRPRNFSQLIRDDHVERLNVAIDCIHEEIKFLIAHGPVTISERVDHAVVTRQGASPELLRVLRDQDDARGDR